jgi:hypothetical protein
MDKGNTQDEGYLGQIYTAQVIGFKGHLWITIDRSNGGIDDERRTVTPEILFDVIGFSQTQFFTARGKNLGVSRGGLVEMSQCTADQTGTANQNTKPL